MRDLFYNVRKIERNAIFDRGTLDYGFFINGYVALRDFYADDVITNLYLRLVACVQDTWVVR